jgi:NhaP-type Na+/H+ or K+/H+ antiporter
MVLILTFVVVLVTLVGQGLTLPAVVRWLGLENAGRREEAERRAEEFETRREAIEAAAARLDELVSEAAVPADTVARLRTHQLQRLAQISIRSDENEERRRQVAQGDELDLLLIAAERELINAKYYRGDLKDETRRRIERELDLREAQLASIRNDDGSE